MGAAMHTNAKVVWRAASPSAAERQPKKKDLTAENAKDANKM